MPEVTQLRLVVTASDYDQALAFYRDVLGLPQRAAYASPSGRVTILEAGHATLELADPPHAAHVDAIEVGRRVAGHVRVAFEVDDTAATAAKLAAAGATIIAEPTATPWRSLNSRLQGPAGLQPHPVLRPPPSTTAQPLTPRDGRQPNAGKRFAGRQPTRSGTTTPHPGGLGAPAAGGAR